MIDRLILLAFLLLGVGRPLTAQPASDQNRDLTDALALAEVWLDAKQDYEDMPGIVAAIVQDQEVVWQGAFGHADVEAGVEMSTETRFHIASISKPFTAVALMTLVDDGTLRLDDRVEEVIPWFEPPVAEYDQAPITLRDLLTHSSGLSREPVTPIWDDAPAMPDGDVLRADLSHLPAEFPSRTVLQYSNAGYMLLGEIIADVSGMPYMEFLRREVLDPLGLGSTTDAYAESLYGDVHAVRYGARDRDGTYPRLGYTQLGAIAPMGGLTSTVGDLARFASWQLRLHEVEATAEVLRPSTLRDMHREHFTDPYASRGTWGLGFFVDREPGGTPLIMHGGHIPGHKSMWILDPADRMAYVALASTSGANEVGLAMGLNGLVDKLEGGSAEGDGRLPREQLLEYTGHYEWGEEMGEAYITPWEGRLGMVGLPTDDPAGSMTLFEHVEGDTFREIRRDGRPGYQLVFVRGEDGSVVSTRSRFYTIQKVTR